MAVGGRDPLGSFTDRVVNCSQVHYVIVCYMYEYSTLRG